MAFLLLGNKIGGINDITANHQCAFKTGYSTFTEKPAYQPQQQGGSMVEEVHSGESLQRRCGLCHSYESTDMGGIRSPGWICRSSDGL